MNFAHDGGMCQKSLLITMEDSRSESLIFRGVSFCGLVSTYSVWLYGSTERSVKDTISSDEKKNHITMHGQKLLHCSYPHLIEKVHLESVQNCLFSTLNMEICDVLGALSVMVKKACKIACFQR